MNIENYKTFLALSKIENFSKTADYLHVVQSTVSSRIFELEKHLDTKLFYRNNRKIEITEAGKSLIPYAIRIVELENESIKTVKNISSFEDNLRLSVPASVYKDNLSKIIYKYYEKNPKITLDIRLHKTDTQLELLSNGDVDIGFISRIPNTNKLEISTYLEYSWMLVAKKDFDIKETIDINDLININLSYNDKNDQYNEWLYDVLPKNFKSRININSTLQLIDYVQNGYGCAFLPSYAIKNELINASIKEIKIKGVKSNKFRIYMAVNKKRIQSKAVTSFLKMINTN